jgi:hypothetical protein
MPMIGQHEMATTAAANAATRANRVLLIALRMR